jgi:hypothetical protein
MCRSSASVIAGWIGGLSIDAPCVALVWQWGFGYLFKVEINASHFVVLGGVIWSAYILDHWFDARATPSLAEFGCRHGIFFIKSNKTPCVVLIYCLGLLFVSIASFSNQILVHGSLLLLAALGYLFLVHFISRKYAVFIPKEIFVGILFSAGSSFFVVEQMENIEFFSVFSPFLIFAFLCFSNCCFISKWEKHRDLKSGQGSIILKWPSMEGFISAVSLFPLLAAFLFYLFKPVPENFEFFCAVGLTVMGFWLIDRFLFRTESEIKRCLADLVMLSPLLTFM